MASLVDTLRLTWPLDLSYASWPQLKQVIGALGGVRKGCAGPPGSRRWSRTGTTAGWGGGQEGAASRYQGGGGVVW